MTTTDPTTIRNRAARDTLHQVGGGTLAGIRSGMYDHTGIRYSQDDVNAALADLIAEGQVRRYVSEAPGTPSRYSLTPHGAALAAGAVEVEEAAEATVVEREDAAARARDAWAAAASEVSALRTLRSSATDRGATDEGLLIDGLLERAVARRQAASGAIDAASLSLRLAQQHLAAVRIG